MLEMYKAETETVSFRDTTKDELIAIFDVRQGILQINETQLIEADRILILGQMFEAIRETVEHILLERANDENRDSDDGSEAGDGDGVEASDDSNPGKCVRADDDEQETGKGTQ